ncbi:MAG: SDR family NAD(P)-dependent oxidoreductase [Candidatus Limnocylindrales bacterium]
MAQIAAVTGSEGFIGSHLVEALVQRGYRVRAMVLYNSFNSWGWLDALSPDILANVDVLLGDVRDPASVRELAEGADVLYHLAALIAIPYSYRSPRSYVDTNVVGTLNVLETTRQLGTPRIVHTSTSEVYGTARAVPIAEDHPLQGQSPYSASKIGADKLAESFHLSFDLPVTTLRPFNTFGPRQSNRAVIPTILSQLGGGATEIHLGETRSTRDFTFVADTVRAFVAVGEAPADAVVGHVLNAGTGVEISIGDLAGLICRVTGKKARVTQDAARLRPVNSEVMRLVCDSTRLRGATGWRPEVELADGIAQTAEWLARPANLARYKWTGYTI